MVIKAMGGFSEIPTNHFCELYPKCLWSAGAGSSADQQL